MLFHLVSQMDRRIFENVVVSLTDIGRYGDLISASGIDVHALGLRPGSLNPIRILHLMYLLFRKRPHVLQTWLYHADLLGTFVGKLAFIPAIIWNVRCAELCRDDHPASLFRVLAWLARLSKNPEVVVANSVAGMEAHVRLGYQPRRWKVLPNGFDLDKFHPDRDARLAVRGELDFSENSLLIGVIGRYHPMKDHSTFLQALARLPETCRNGLGILLAGRGVDGRNMGLCREIAALGLSDSVRLIGERQDIPRLNAALDIAVSSSYSEGFSNAIGEAMACGVPCVVTDAGDSATIVGKTGMIVPPKDPAAMAVALQRMIEMPSQERLNMGAAARDRIATEYSLETVVKRYEELYRELGER